MPSTNRSLVTQPRAQRSKRLLIPLAVSGVAVVGTVGLAIAAPTKPTLSSAHNAQLGKTIVVDAKGQTVYALRPETTHHLLCASKACFQVWPPVTVSPKAKLKAGQGMQGGLGTLRRSKSVLQVTLGGLPLYRFAPDRNIKGNANGQGIQSFGGTWHVIGAKAAKTTKTPTSATTTSAPTTPTPPAYTIPGY